MTAVTRGSQPAERGVAEPVQEQGAATTVDSAAVGRRTTAAAADTTKGTIRGRLAERMAEIAQKSGYQPPVSASTQVPPPIPSSAQPAHADQSTTNDAVRAATSPNPSAPVEKTATPAAPKSKAEQKIPTASELFDRLKAEHQSLLRKLHERIFDAPREQLFFVSTKNPEALSTLTIASPNRVYGHDYRPVPCQVFDWALNQIPEDLSGFTFVDYGAGKGRAMLMAAERPFAAVAGVEFAEELHDNAEMNIAQYPRSKMRCRNVECILEDAVQVGPPEGASVHYFFNPFDREVFAEVLKNIVRAYRMKPRRLYLVLIDPIAIDLVDASGVFARVEPTQVDVIKLSILCLHTVAVYRSLA